MADELSKHGRPPQVLTEKRNYKTIRVDEPSRMDPLPMPLNKNHIGWFGNTEQRQKQSKTEKKGNLLCISMIPSIWPKNCSKLTLRESRDIDSNSYNEVIALINAGKWPVPIKQEMEPFHKSCTWKMSYLWKKGTVKYSSRVTVGGKGSG